MRIFSHALWSSRIWTLVPKIACETTFESHAWIREHVDNRAVDHGRVRFGNGDNGHGETQEDGDSHIFDIRRTRPAAGSPVYTLAGFTGNEGGFGFLRRHPHPVDAVERRRLVALGQGRVVEHRVHEVVDLAAETQHRLTDVDQFAGAFADDVDAEQFAGVGAEDDLQQTGDVADDLPARDLAIDSALPTSYGTPSCVSSSSVLPTIEISGIV